MKKYLISLDKDSQRRELFFSQPDTSDFQVFSAINTMQKEWKELAEVFNIDKFKHIYGRDVTKGEIGCTLSHLAVYQLIADDVQIADEDYALVCEDDALFNENFQQNLTALLRQEKQADIILVGQSKINLFNDLELELNYPIFNLLAKRIKNTPFKTAYPYKNYFAGTVAYLILKSAAKKFLQTLTNENNKAFWLADDFLLFEQNYKMDILVVRPLMAIENPKLTSNLSVARIDLSNNLFKKLIKHTPKKFLALKRNLGRN